MSDRPRALYVMIENAVALDGFSRASVTLASEVIVQTGRVSYWDDYWTTISQSAFLSTFRQLHHCRIVCKTAVSNFSANLSRFDHIPVFINVDAITMNDVKDVSHMPTVMSSLLPIMNPTTPTTIQTTTP